MTDSTCVLEGINIDDINDIGEEDEEVVVEDVNDAGAGIPKEHVLTKNQVSRQKLRKKIAEKRSNRTGSMQNIGTRSMGQSMPSSGQIGACMKDPNFMKEFSKLTGQLGVRLPQAKISQSDIHSVLKSMQES